MDTALIADVKAAWERYLQDKFDEEVAKKGKASWPSLMKEMTPEVIEKHVSTDEKFKMKLTAANAGFYAIEEAITHVNAQGPGSAEQGHVLVDKAKDVLCEWLDKEVSYTGPVRKASAYVLYAYRLSRKAARCRIPPCSANCRPIGKTCISRI